MRFSEFGISEARKMAAPSPSVLKQQQRVGRVMQQIAVSDQQQEPTELDKVLAIRRYADWQKQTDKAYAQLLKQQLAAVERV